jgi:glycosyltransferase involved in cell wall biosynthesis
VNVLLLEPYCTGSHAAWADGYAAHSRHQVTVLTLPGRFWKWRMHGGAVTLAHRFLALETAPDLILATDMLDLTTFLALTRARTHRLPVALYFHENQLSYPWSPDDRDVQQGRDVHYGFINYASALAADAVFFNSTYHLDSFFDELPRLLKHFPDYNELDTVDALRAKSDALPLGLDLRRFDAFSSSQPSAVGTQPLILWNHRWEYDKNPEDFFRALVSLADRELDFGVILLGESFRQQPGEFVEAQRRLGDRVRHFGYAPDFGDYARWLWQADLLPVTSRHDFFGASVVEAIYCGCFPLLPRRLSYPELIPPAYHDLCFYRDFDDLVNRLASAIEGGPIRQTALRDAVARFDWHELAPVYDERLEEVAGICKTGSPDFGGKTARCAVLGASQTAGDGGPSSFSR